MWTYEQTCTNVIEIRRDGEKVAEVCNDGDESSPEDFENAEFIIKACNAYEQATWDDKPK